MKSIRVRLSHTSYKITFGPYQTQLSRVLKKMEMKPSRIFMVTSHAVKKAGYATRLKTSLRKRGYKVHLETVANGEVAKSLGTLERLYRRGLKFGLDRRSLVIAVGGGVVTDLAGYFAATYMRGIPYISMPTTLLGMVDASIGGKTGIDLREGKNLVGAFHQPKLVWIDTSVLKTLPIREWKTGFAEIIKYGVIYDSRFFHWLGARLKKNSKVHTWTEKDLERAIFTSAKIKAEVVSKDEKETPLKGGREILNFGHTTGHALEAATVYRNLTHGEAISIGMVVAGHISLDRRSWSLNAQLELLSMLQAVGLPIHCPKLRAKEKRLFWDALQRDKKNIAGKLRFVLPSRIGKVAVKSDISPAVVRKALRLTGF